MSAARLQTDMIESMRLRPGAILFEAAGSGGYNAELIAHVAGREGWVVTVDIDPWVVRRTRAFLTEAGSGRVTSVEADAALGAPAQATERRCGNLLQAISVIVRPGSTVFVAGHRRAPRGPPVLHAVGTR